MRKLNERELVLVNGGSVGKCLAGTAGTAITSGLSGAGIGSGIPVNIEKEALYQ